ncbi:hypothetical protein EHS25_006992 [Saitozyma podzolica]|uniref:Uncharacterized protein n=1 Tax=Saitozyma podzolica TaxID=1890683 RepID=A0A427XPS2_9TREE|nr:hypothetical protein EHS25_006992 [Saitozyma podzolica]
MPPRRNIGGGLSFWATKQPRRRLRTLVYREPFIANPQYYNAFRLNGLHPWGFGKHKSDVTSVCLVPAITLKTAVAPGTPPDVPPTDTVATIAQQ